MKQQAATALLLIIAVSAHAQDAVPPVTTDDTQSVTLVVNADGLLVTGSPDGTLSAEGFVVPEGYELQVNDLVWYVVGEPGADSRIGLLNTNIDGVSNYIIWQVTPALNASGEAAGTTSFAKGPIVTTNGGLSLFGTDPFNLTIYATLHALLPPELE